VTTTSATVSVTLAQNNDNRPGDNITPPSDNNTKADFLKDKGVPGKGIDNAPGLQKPVNPNSHGGGQGNMNHQDNQGHNNSNQSNNGHGKGPGNGNQYSHSNKYEFGRN
jgi:hypothetical protein